jgi:hypothetical protein
MKDFSLQGICYLADRDANGLPINPVDVDNASLLQVKFTSDVSRPKESRSGLRLPRSALSKGIDATFSLTLTSGTAFNFAIGLYGSKVAITAGDVAAGSDLFPDDVTAGQIIQLSHRNITDLVLKDSNSGAPATLTEGTDYTILSAAAGLVKVLNVASFTQPFDPAYSFAAGIDIAMFTSQAPEKYLILDAKNTVQGTSDAVGADLYRCVFDPLSSLDLLNDDYGEIALTGSLLYDELNAANSNRGGFALLHLPAEA